MNDKNGLVIEVGEFVIGENPDNGQEFMGRVKAIKQDTDGSWYAEVADKDDDVFCLTSENIECEEWNN